MRILILNWRDIKNPGSGGAEVLTHEIAKYWVSWGHTVTQFSSAFKGGKKVEVIDGIKFIRGGSSMIRSFHVPVHIAAYLWYKRHRKEFDVIVDEIHGIPFFSTLYADIPVAPLICEVAGDLWNIAFPFPGNIIGRAMEMMSFLLYRSKQFMTISPSSRDELIAMGIARSQVIVLPMGLSMPRQIKKLPKEKTLTLIYVGRLTKPKGIEDAISIVKLLKEEFSTVKLWVIGNGDKEYRKLLDKKVKEFGLESAIRFFGFTSEKEKFELLSRAHILVVPSYKEGWGLTVPEAGLVGTPAIGYNVAGLRDVIIDGKTGTLTSPDPVSMKREISKLFHDSVRYKEYAGNALVVSKKYSWESTARTALSILEALVGSSL